MLSSSSSSSSISSGVFVCEKADMDVKKRKMDPKESVGLLIKPSLSMEFNKQEEEEEEAEEEHSNDTPPHVTFFSEECKEVKTPPPPPRRRYWECPGAPRKAKAKKRKTCGDNDDQQKIMAHSHLCRHLESLFPAAVNKRLKHRPITG